MKTIAILGAGPAGLMAAHAVGLCGLPLSIHSQPEKSVLGGAQYLHHPIPCLTANNPDRVITNKLQGSAEGYRTKVYGTDPSRVPQHVSAMSVTDGEKIKVWDLGKAYDTLWSGFGYMINRANVSSDWIDEHANEFDMIISSIPAPFICKNRDFHRFHFQEVWISSEIPSWVMEDTVVYNGDPSPAWYRASNIGGTAGGVEWSTNGPKPPISGLRLVKKPLSTNCDCYPEIFRVGRYGQWRKGVLAHDAYYETGRMIMGKSTDQDLSKQPKKADSSDAGN